ncbi:MAG: adenylate/guanylate cyclase domain-containing protein [Pseudomonadota bacterium]
MSKVRHLPPSDSFVERLEKKLGTTFPEEDRAQLSQFIHDYTDYAPKDHTPTLTPVTVLMADLRGFSELAGELEPEGLVGLLQPFFMRMTEVVHQYGGFIDKFLGDGVMALFGAPDKLESNELNALACAAEMQCAIDELNRRNATLQVPPLFVGIGISSGEVMAGVFGSNEYKEYTVLGDAVNLAARLEKFALRGEVLLSESCYRGTSGRIELSSTRELRVRGQSLPVKIHSLRAVTAPHRIQLPNVESRTSPRIPVDLPLVYHTIENQRVLPKQYEGNILNLGYGGMLAQIPLPLPEMGEITFAISESPTAIRHEDVYARALQQHPVEGGFQTAFAFTSVGSHGQDAVRRCVDQMLWGL